MGVSRMKAFRTWLPTSRYGTIRGTGPAPPAGGWLRCSCSAWLVREVGAAGKLSRHEPTARSLDERLTPNEQLKPAASRSSLVVFINECAAA